MKELVLLLPEIFMAFTLAGLIVSEISYHGEKIRLTAATALVGLSGALVQTVLNYRFGASLIFGNALSIDGLSLFFKLFFILLAIFAVLISLRAKEIGREKRTEFYGLIVASALAMAIVASATDLLLAFLALQFMNILGYFLSAFGRRSPSSTEASVKLLAFGAVSGALYLYGTALLFSATHSIDLHGMHQALSVAPLPRDSALVIFTLMFLAFAFQMSAFPMHLWTADVLEGAPTPSSAFLSLGSRAAGFALAIRFFVVIFAKPALAAGQWQVAGDLNWPEFLAVVAGLTMIVGALLAYRQNRAKRLVANLVVAETGFLLMGLLILDQVGLAAVLYTFVVELFALLGAFFVLSFLIDELKSDRLEDLRGVLGRAVPECICLILFLICLVGLPPLPGFIGKFALIGAAIRHQWHFLALVAIAAMAISTVAVAKLAYSLVGDFSKTARIGKFDDTPHRALLAALFVPMFVIGVFAERVMAWAGQSLQFILW